MSTWPPKTNYAAGDILTAAQMTDIGNQMTPLGYTAGKNKIINGDFGINQRGFSSTTADNTYMYDRWRTFINSGSGTTTFSAQTFTLGTAPVSGYESTNFIRCVTASPTGASSYSVLAQFVEDVRILSGQTVTISFWAKAGSGTPSISCEAIQNFGSGGSTRTPVAASVNKFSLSTSWTRYSFSFTMPSMSGKTIGAGSYTEIYLWVSAGSDFNSRTGSLGIQSNTFDIWGVQLEAGSVATAFQTATGTIQGELAACQRYYYKSGTETNYEYVCNVAVDSANTVLGTVYLPVKMRTLPTLSSAGSWMAYISASIKSSPNQLGADSAGTTIYGINMSGFTGLTAGQAGNLRANNDPTAYIAFSAEL